jgi:hypothetical protein
VLAIWGALVVSIFVCSTDWHRLLGAALIYLQLAQLATVLLELRERSNSNAASGFLALDNKSRQHLPVVDWRSFNVNMDEYLQGFDV